MENHSSSTVWKFVLFYDESKLWFFKFRQTCYEYMTKEEFFSCFQHLLSSTFDNNNSCDMLNDVLTMFPEKETQI